MPILLSMRTRWLAGLLLVMPALAGWKPLFNGRNFTGCEQVGQALWTIEDGAIAGSSDPAKPGTMHSKNMTVKFKDLEIEE